MRRDQVRCALDPRRPIAVFGVAAVLVVAVVGCSPSDDVVTSAGVAAGEVGLKQLAGSMSIVGTSWNSDYLPVLKNGTDTSPAKVFRLETKTGRIAELPVLPTDSAVGDSDIVSIGDDVVLSTTPCEGEPVVGDAGLDCAGATADSRVLVFTGATGKWTDLGTTGTASYLPVYSVDDDQVTLAVRSYGQGLDDRRLTNVRLVQLGDTPTIAPQPDTVPMTRCTIGQMDSPVFPDPTDLRRLSYVRDGRFVPGSIDQAIAFPPPGGTAAFLSCAGSGRWLIPQTLGPLSSPLPDAAQPTDVPSAVKGTEADDPEATVEPPQQLREESRPAAGTLQLVDLSGSTPVATIDDVPTVVSVGSGSDYLAIDASTELLLRRTGQKPVQVSKSPDEQLRGTAGGPVLVAFDDTHRLRSMRVVG